MQPQQNYFGILIKMQGPRGFSTSKRTSWFDQTDRSIPGPGAHSPNEQKSIPSCKISKALRSNTFLDPHRAEYPAPGDYKVNPEYCQKNTKTFSIPQSKLQQKKSDNVQVIYNAEPIKTKQPEYSFGNSAQHNYETSVPAPGTYECESMNFTGLSFNRKQKHFGHSLRRHPATGESLPGPGDYNIVEQLNSTKFSFTKAPKQMEGGCLPPAVHYEIGKKKEFGKGFLMVKHKPQKEEEPTPGPSDYENQKQHRIHNVFVEKSKRSSLDNAAIRHNPSPDSYNTLCPNRIKCQSFFRQKRRLLQINESLPAANQYEIKLVDPALSKRGGVMGIKSKLPSAETTPSSFDYSLNFATIQTKPQTAVNMRSHRSDFSRTITGKIGPGDYEVNQHKSIELGTIPKSGRVQPPKIKPGPGSYEMPSYFGRLPKYYCAPPKITRQGYACSTIQMKAQRFSQKERGNE